MSRDIIVTFGMLWIKLGKVTFMPAGGRRKHLQFTELS